jgi:DNA-binding transcriptional LysR family regulator
MQSPWHITQSSLSKRVAELEAAVGARHARATFQARTVAA